jgi:molybdenum cofactor synthesis domain-containing protein
LRAAVVSVGDELLAGETVNTNASWLCSRLAENGVGVERVVVSPDDKEAVSEEVRRLADRHDAVVVTGGLGPTPDDVTAEGIARAFGKEIEVTKEAREAAAGYSGDVSDDVAAVPEGACPVPNPEGVAPGFALENVFALPGVPSEMKAVFGEIEAEFEGEAVSVAHVHTDEPESELLSRLEEARDSFGVEVRSYPDEDGVRLKITGEEDAVGEAREWLAERV